MKFRGILNFPPDKGGLRGVVIKSLILLDFYYLTPALPEYSGLGEGV